LLAPLKVLRAPRALVDALEIPDECSSEVSPIMYGAGRQVLEPSCHPLCKMDKNELDDQVVVLDSRHAARESVVFQPYAGIHGAIVLGDIG
jgi:uracil phosphoribosyltransferase